ncbi:MAG TPA: DUF4118 domain-containing protein, partial [Pirellulaceae bacterium]|nr:DUF4118 domain-containing protein [Pirellulaceae bacterium]
MPYKIGPHDGPRARIVASGIGLLAGAIALLLRWYLSPVLGERALYSSFLPAVLIAAYFGGLWPGLLVTIFCAAAANYFLVDPHFSLALEGPGDATALVIFALTGAFISGLCESLHRAQRRLADEERRRAEAALRQSEERFQQLIQFSSDIIGFFAADGTILYQSPSIERVLGYHPGERIGKNVFRDPLVHPDDLATKRAFFEKVKSSAGSPVTGEFRLRHL